MTKRILICLCIIIAVVSGCSRNNPYSPEAIVWNGVSEDETASFPFGNGVVAGNAWAEKDGIYIYLSRNDCFSELGRLLKVGKLKLTFDSALLDNCVQKLDLENGMLEFCNSNLNLNIFADSELPVIWIHGKLSSPSSVSINPVIWRNSPHKYNSQEREGFWNLKDYPGDFPIMESADKFFNLDDCTGFFHHNDTSTYEFTLRNNHLQDIGVKDPFKNRTFGAMLSSDNLHFTQECSLESLEPVSEFTIKVAVTSFPDCTQENWKAKTLSILNSSGMLDKAEARTRIYWNQTWKRSYLKISTPDTITGKKITELYNCQRWITLCAGKSSYAIRHNGSLFTLAPGKIRTNTDFNPDYRRWGECYWWQNTRLPYFSMLKTGDWETIHGLASFYHNVMPALKEQAKVYYGAEGATIPETITQFGTFSATDYGFGTEEIGAQNLYVRHIFQDQLELIHMMMDCYRYSGDEDFMKNHIIPMSEEFLDFYISYAKPDSLGKMRIKNTQSLETYWFGVENDLPVVAGLHAVVKDFKNLPSGKVIPSSLAQKIEYIREMVPDIPTGEDTLGNKVFLPAEKYENRTNNYQNPELMAVFPFELCNFTSENVEVGRNSFNNRKFILKNGWASDCQEAAILGMTDEAKSELLSRIENRNKAFRFPTYFGPNNNWVPDQDHGGSIMIGVQDMVMQSYDGKVYLLPAFPEDWDVQFRFAVPGKAFVWGNYSGGKWIEKPQSDNPATIMNF